MAKVNLAKALKMKNSLIGEINRLKTIFIRENSRQAGSKSTVDRQALLNEIEAKSIKLVDLKSKITQANVGVYPVLCRMEETKALITWFPTIPTKHGVFTEYAGREYMPVQYDALVKQEDVDKLIAEAQAKIEALQDEADTYNATTFIDV